MRNDSQRLASLHAVDGVGTVRLQDTYDTGIDDLWSALTDPARLSRWIAEVDGDLRPGGRVTITFTSGWEGAGRIEVCEAPRRLLVTLSAEGEGDTVLEAALTEQDGRTLLTIEERGLPLQALPAHGAGWQVHVEDLAAHLAGRERSDWSRRWQELTPAYRDEVDTAL